LLSQGKHIKADVIEMTHWSNLDKPGRGPVIAYYIIEYQFTVPETRRTYSRRVRINYEVLALSQNPEEVARTGLNVVYDPSDPTREQPECIVSSWVNGRFITFLIFAFATLLAAGFFTVATLLPKNVLRQRLEEGYARM
jgi:hypothetical protein